MSLVDNANEYLSYITQINERYLRKQGEVFTVSWWHARGSRSGVGVRIFSYGKSVTVPP